MKTYLTIILILLAATVIYFVLIPPDTHSFSSSLQYASPSPTQSTAILSPNSIAAMQFKSYPGSPLTIVSTLSPGPNYSRYVVSYQSDGLTLFGLLTVPTGTKPSGGWPVILLNHGYIPPSQYSTIDSYASFVDPLAAAGFIVFKPDYRGNGNSPGTPVQPYISPDYVTDSMNAFASIKQFPDANPQKIGVLGHSMGGNITLHELVISPDFKAAELMSGVVGNETDIVNWWQQRIATKSIIGNDLETAQVIQQMIQAEGLPADNPDYWNSIDPTQYLVQINVPVQIQVGSADTTVPPQFSISLNDSLKALSKTVEFHEYPNADHNLAPDTSAALTRTITFFNKYLQ